MCSGSVRKGRWKADARLVLLFSLIFSLSTLLLFLLSLYFWSWTLERDDRALLQSKMLSYWARAQSRGMENFLDEIVIESHSSSGRLFLFRLADKANRTVFLSVPEVWRSFDTEILEKSPPEPRELVILKSPDLAYQLEIGTLPLNPDFFLQVGMSNQGRLRLVAVFQRGYSLVALILIALSLISGYLLARRYLKPLRGLAETVEVILDTGDTDARIPLQSVRGELGDLALSFNAMLERMDNLIRGMKGALDTVAHDLRTPLTRFRMAAEKALTESDAMEDPVRARDVLAEAVEAALLEAETIQKMMTVLMDISEAESGVLKLNVEIVDWGKLAREVLDVYELVAEEKGIALEYRGAEGLPAVQADPLRLRQVVGNFLDNALKFTPAGGRVVLALEEGGDVVRLRVEDNGRGIAEGELESIWKRLYRGRSSAHGMGLGLSLVKAVVTAHGGRVGARSRLGEGSCFYAELPAAGETRGTASPDFSE